MLSRVVPSAHPTRHCGGESHVESWWLTVNSSLSKRGHIGLLAPPFSPGGAREGLGVRVGVEAQELLHFK